MNSCDLNKKEKYENIERLIDEMVQAYDGLSDLAIMASLSSAVKREFEEFSFVGFYLVTNENVLEVGPYVSEIVAVPRIGYGKGVCGSSFEKKETIIVNNVAECNNYIACSIDVKSEIVVPVIKNGQVIAVLDIDSTILDRFDDEDKNQLEKLIGKYFR